MNLYMHYNIIDHSSKQKVGAEAIGNGEYE